MMAMNILYDGSARDEHPDKTGFAHLFEHLMFGAVPCTYRRYDEPCSEPVVRTMLLQTAISPQLLPNPSG